MPKLKEGEMYIFSQHYSVFLTITYYIFMCDKVYLQESTIYTEIQACCSNEQGGTTTETASMLYWLFCYLVTNSLF